jgi:7-cyano-7-deazaguanine synthase
MDTSMKRAVVLLSSGLDSLTACSQAVKEFLVVRAITFDYGQRSARQEIARAKKIARYYRIPHSVIRLPWFVPLIKTALVDRKKPLPQLKKTADGSLSTAAAVWVPNRNGVFLNIAAAYAESEKADIIVTGFNAEEAKTFPDNTQEFCTTADKFFSYSTQNKVTVKNYFSKKNKKEIYALAKKNQAPLEYVWPCYEGGWRLCGHCESCVRFFNAKESYENAIRQ